eukprot:GEZU01035652.1.p1 GENE.GEZU01035652.1~~GEZU01035652.1.p1  ORF type:complete len:216 (+),score=36.38 GEZU01035652.1:382-1029(+)
MNQSQPSPASKPQFDVKVVLVGAVGVGKTSTVMRFIKDSFKDYLETTIGASYMCKTLRINDETDLKFSVWDTAGQEQYHSLVPLYFRNAAAVLVVYDITREATFEDAKNWVKELDNQAPDDVIIALVGNKSDLEDIRQVKRATGEDYANTINAIFTETSAKADVGIADLFKQLGQMYLRKMDLKRRSVVKIEENELDHVTLSKDMPQEQQSRCKC